MWRRQALMFSPRLRGVNLQPANGAGKVPARRRLWGGDKFESTLVHYMECASQTLSSPPTCSPCDLRDKSFMDEDELFCMSLVGTFKRLPPQKKELAKIRVQSLLYELQYGSPQPAPLSTLSQHAPMMASQNFQQHQSGPCIPTEGGVH